MSFRVDKETGVQSVLRSNAQTTEVGKEYLKRTPENCVIRTYEDSANNLNHPDWGMAKTPLLRKSASAYGDGSSTLNTRTPTPREISNAICKKTADKPNTLNLSDMCWLWGQYLDHTVDLSKETESETANMTTPGNDAYPGRTIPFKRSEFVKDSDPREQLNDISSFVDATNVYGNSDTRAYKLRLLDGSGKLKTTTADNGEDLPPYNVFDLANAAPPGSNAEDFFLVGDIRGNENVLLTGMHTIFIREHNRLCDEIKALKPTYTEEMIFQYARRKVISFIQNITYEEFLPALLGQDGLSKYTGYKSSVNPSIATEFSTAGYRLGHTMVSNEILVNFSGATIGLVDAFFNPAWVKANGISNAVASASKKAMQQIDNEIVDNLRDNLFGPPTAQQLIDLASLNIQRGRDHGLPDYNTMREAYGLPKYTQFSQITSDVALQNKLSSTYPSIDGIDPWVGGICEDHMQGKAVGPLINAILKDQFERLRDGDRFWWENDLVLSQQEKNEIKKTKLSEIIKRNTGLDVAADVFHV